MMLRQGAGVAVLLAAALFMTGANAVIETYEFSDPALEYRYHVLSEELRCPKCQNQNIADSNAPIAKDLRRLLYQQLESGATDEQILHYMVERYGEFVRYRPRFGGSTLALWLAPAALLIAGLTLLVITVRGKRRANASRELTDEDLASLREILGNEEKPT